MKIKEFIVNNDIRLKEMEKSDAEIIFFAINSNRRHLRKWLPFVDMTKTVKDTISFVDSIIDNYEKRQEVFCIFYKDEFAGLVGLKDIDHLNKKIEIGYWIIEKMLGKGIVTQSVEKIIEYAYNELNMNRICIKCAVNNIKSSAVPKRLGFDFEGIERAGEKHTAHYVNLEVYSLLKKDWFDIYVK